MTEDELQILKTRFYDYTSPFAERAEDPYPYILKQKHTLRVCDNITMLARSLNLGKDETRLAWAAALVHDIGRFPQFETYSTFSDTLSKNHGAMGVGVLVKQGIVKGLCRPEKCLLLRAIALHNRARLPDGLENDLDLLARMLRDADKIDIFKVIKEYYLSRESKPFITHNLEDDGKVSTSLMTQLLNDRPIEYYQIRTLNDLKLFQIGMVYDLNFTSALSAIQKQGVISAILHTMPQSPLLKSLEQHLNTRMETAIAGQTNLKSVTQEEYY